jgi:phosphoribosylamine--glycine ligase
MEGVTVFHAGTALPAGTAPGPRAADPGAVVTAGGRVLGVTALGPSLAEARSRAYRAVAAISWPGAQARTDIARVASAEGPEELVGSAPEAVVAR